MCSYTYTHAMYCSNRKNNKSDNSIIFIELKDNDRVNNHNNHVYYIKYIVMHKYNNIHTIINRLQKLFNNQVLKYSLIKLVGTISYIIILLIEIPAVTSDAHLHDYSSIT